jgi:SAM-dependent methyltransferase
MSFDPTARTYDQDFSQSPIAALLRQRVWARLGALHPQPARLLELGCGTGEDACFLAGQGHQVTATDASPAMLEVTRAKAGAAGLSLECQALDFNRPESWPELGQFAGAYSNFGALNCTNRWGELGAYLGDHLAPGAKLLLVVMGPFCLWESLWHGLHGDMTTATRRWGGESLARLGDGSPFPVYYPSPRALARALGPQFRRLKLWGLGVFLPPSEIYPPLQARPRLQNALSRLEYLLADYPPFKYGGDHYVLELVRV